MPIHFGVSICTYYKNESTYDGLDRAFASVAAQTHEDWTVYLIGDRFGDVDGSGWDNVRMLSTKHFGMKCKRINLPFAAERDSGIVGRDLWCCGGVNAHNFSLEWMRCDKVDVHATLDHDDFWLPNHLELLAREYESDSELAFAYTCGWHLKKTRLPMNPDFNPAPRSGQVVHSSVSWRQSMIPFGYVREPGVPSDSIMWTSVRNHLRSRSLRWKCIPEVTVNHETEGCK